MLVIRSTDCSVKARCCSSSSAFFAPAHQFGVAVFRLGQPAFGSGDFFLHFRGSLADLLVDFLEKLREREIDVVGDTINLHDPLLPNFV